MPLYLRKIFEIYNFGMTDMYSLPYTDEMNVELSVKLSSCLCIILDNLLL